MNIAKYNAMAESPQLFRNELLVDCDGSIRRFGDCMDDFQRQDFAKLDHALKRCNGRSNKYKVFSCNRAYLERSRGHSKTTDLAVMVSWVLAFSTRSLKGYAFAADKDQAKLLKDAIETLIRLNPWLGRILEVQRDKVANIAKGHPGEGSRLEIFTSDVGSSYGILPDFIICDELCHWEGDGSLWHSILSSAAKRKNCFLAIISNAGFTESWQWHVREAAREDRHWYFSRLDGPVASWITEKRLEEQRRMLPSIAFKRLWLNEWSSGGGDALTEEDIEAAFSDNTQPMQSPSDEYYYVGGLDLGLKRDCAGFVVLAIPKGGKSGKIRLAHNKLWRPTQKTKINLLAVERHILETDERLGLSFIAFDPWQAELMSQAIEADSGRRRRNAKRLLYRGLPFMREIPPTPTNLRQQATLTIESFQDRRFQFYDCEPLKRDLHRLRVEEKAYGFRLVSPRDGSGHGDTASAFCLALLIAHEMAGKKPTTAGAFEGGHSALAAFEARQREYQNEEEMLASIEDDPFADALRNQKVKVSVNNIF